MPPAHPGVPRRHRHRARVRSDGLAALIDEATSGVSRLVGEYLGARVGGDAAPPRREDRGGGEALPALDPLFLEVTSQERLLAAWRSVLARDARDGELRRQTERIAARVEDVIADLSESLRCGTYQPEPLSQVRLPKRAEGEYRTLEIPGIRDRIVERAIVDVVGPRADALMSPCSYGYRPGLGVDDAIQHLAELRDVGMVHVLRTDIEDFFPHVRLAEAIDILSRAVFSRRLLGLVALLASPRRTWSGWAARAGGVAQGSSLSPMLANLAFTEVDEALTTEGIGYVRFADDVVVCAESPERLAYAQRLLVDAARQRGFKLKEEKSVITGFDEGFCYLGVDLGSVYPAVDPRHDVDDDAVADRVVYVGRDGARVSVTKDRLVVESEHHVPYLSIPRRAVRRIVLMGAVGLSAGARSWALYNDVDVVLLSRRGTYLGQLSGKRSDLAGQRLLAQCAATQDEARRLGLSRLIVAAKMRNQMRLLQRTARREITAGAGTGIEAIRAILGDVPHAQSIDELMGLEGAASASYFEALGGLVPPEVSFPGRSRRPPMDVANAAMSYGYALLLGECAAALYAAGLEPSLGLLHSTTDKRPSLALDLMEEFRPLLVDRAVLGLLRQRRLRAEHGGPVPEEARREGDGEEGVWLTGEGKKVLLSGYEAALQRETSGALPGFGGTWRRHIHHQAQRLARAILDPDYEWSGTSWR